ncbi:MAG: efflux transporter outer membrane subunit [Gammaproteobacteria bacterium]|nr:MAG: efflux transporter outer membrane subunit [Gammaproteobacteria bacterium]TLY87448.1 MAG: efflux transporter outer membrane subunit [Gammaproteobacteria bacterium]
MTDSKLKRRAAPARLGVPIALLALTALAGCAVGPNYVKPDSKVAPQFEGARDGAFSSADAQAKFWTQFGDDTLNRLVDEALQANHDLRMALGRLVEARAIRREAGFDLAPTVTAAGGYTRERLPALESPTRTLLQGHLYDAGFDAFWELDFFGRVRRGVEARHAELEGAEASLRDAQVSVTAEVARTYFELRGAQTELAVAQRNVDNQRETAGLTQARLDAGRGTELDTSRARSQLSTTLTTIGPLQAQVARSIHRLAVLTGREPNALNDLLTPPHELPELPQITAVGDPAALLRRRPDIRVAERSLAASTARVGVAIGDLFPKVTFTGNFTYTATEPAYLGQSSTRGYVIGPGISWAAFDLGRVRAQIAGSRARADVALAGYEQTVLRALEETENALVTHARTRDSLEDAQDAARESLTAARIARTRYEGGMVDFLEVLDAERTQLAAEDRLAQVRTDAATSLIAVYKALGGGWEMTPLPRYVRQAGG